MGLRVILLPLPTKVNLGITINSKEKNIREKVAISWDHQSVSFFYVRKQLFWVFQQTFLQLSHATHWHLPYSSKYCGESCKEKLINPEPLSFLNHSFN